LNILLVSTNVENYPDPVFPIGLSYVASAAAKEGHDVKVVDLLYGETVDSFIENGSNGWLADVLGISIRNVENICYPKNHSYVEGISDFVKMCKAKTNIPIILGGAGFSVFPDEWMKLTGATYGVRGEGEKAFVDILKSISSGDLSEEGKVFFGGSESKFFLNHNPTREHFNVSDYYQQSGCINIQSKRGCSMSCTYCVYPLIEGNTVRTRPVENVVDEMELLSKEYGIKYFYFVDSVFNIPESYTVELCEAIIKRKLKIKWTAYVNPMVSDFITLDYMKKSGCVGVELGVDSLSDKTLKSLKKGYSVDKILEFCSYSDKIGLKYAFSVIFGVPEESAFTIDETIKNIGKTNPKAIFAFTGLRVYKNTPLASMLIKSGEARESDISIGGFFYIEDSVKDNIISTLHSTAAKDKRWIVPGLSICGNEEKAKIIRGKGMKGPSWVWI